MNKHLSLLIPYFFCVGFVLGAVVATVYYKKTPEYQMGVHLKYMMGKCQQTGIHCEPVVKPMKIHPSIWGQSNGTF